MFSCFNISNTDSTNTMDTTCVYIDYGFIWSAWSRVRSGLPQMARMYTDAIYLVIKSSPLYIIRCFKFSSEDNYSDIRANLSG